MRVILHMGTDKTGSTSLQRVLNANRSELLKCGIHYSLLDTDSHNDKETYLFFGSDLNHFSQEMLQSNPSASENKYLERFEKTLTNLAPNETLVLSHEGLMYLSHESLMWMLGFINRYVDDVRVILYARDVFSYAVSAKSQRAKTARTSSAFNPPYILYCKVLDKLECIFGRENIEIRKYNYGNGFDIVDDFFKSKWLLGSKVSGLKSVAHFRNYSLNSTSYAVANSIVYLSEKKWEAKEFRVNFLDYWSDIKGERLALNIIERVLLKFYTRKHQARLLAYGVEFECGDVKGSIVGVNCSYLKALFLAKKIMKKENISVSQWRLFLSVLIFTVRDLVTCPQRIITK